ncbi:hypothetical protein BHQ18_24020 [Mycolicibacterium flavescens]|uniref:Uncharacterized protein n=1 Tax=Mycolicibacterium flavescens TaxID=1776 RepID=A0A1E3RC38_MYCFV|nr:hypothetical protein BHQ18_24020 [Mycolicibacterium flavescens]
MTCDEQRRRLASPAALLGAAPVFVPAPASLRDQTLREVQLTSSTATVHPITARADEGRSTVLPVAVFVIALIAALGAVALWATSPTTTTVPVPIEAGQTMAPPVPAHVGPAPVTPSVTAAPVTSERRAATARPAVSVPTTAPVAPPSSPSPAVSSPPPTTPPAPPPAWPPFPDLPQWPQFPQWPDGAGPDPGDPSDPGGTFTGPSDLGSLPSADPPPVG